MGLWSIGRLTCPYGGLARNLISINNMWDVKFVMGLKCELTFEFLTRGLGPCNPEMLQTLAGKHIVCNRAKLDK